MRHIELHSADAPPCNGEIHYSPLPPRATATGNRPYQSLPILGAPIKEQPMGEWICDRCGKKWSIEPLPQEAL